MTIRQGKILIVDDNEDILFTLKMLLRPRVGKYHHLLRSERNQPVSF